MRNLVVQLKVPNSIMQTAEFKVYLQNSDSTVREIRRFKLDRKVTQDFAYLRQTLNDYFRDIRGKDFDVLWKDADNDKILIRDTEELQIAGKYLHANGTRLYVRLGPQKQETQTLKKEGVTHRHIYCDHCDCNISGIRYKCIQCEDYDLCSECEASGAHPKHYMIRMPRPVEWSSYYGRRLLQHMKKFFKWVGAQPSKDKDAGPSKETPERADKNDSFLDLDINIEIIPETPNTPESKKTEKEEEPVGNAPTVENTAAKVPEQGSKPDTSTDVEASMPNSKSPVMNEEAPVKTTATEGWTMIDRNEASGNSCPSSVSSNVSDTSEKHDSAPLPLAPKEHASCQTIYPLLEEEQEEIYSTNPRIRAATEIMMKMGFSNEGGLLTHLLEVEDCNINKVLDFLQSNSSK